MLESTKRLKWPNIPTALTIARMFAVPALIACLYLLENGLIDENVARWSAFALFVVASFTDWLDGHLARRWKQQSTLGAMLDPIADKLLVGATLMMLVYDRTLSGSAIIPATIILCREILVSGLREFLASLNVKILVTFLAKWKTFLQFLALALLLIGPKLETQVPGITFFAIVLLWLASILTLWTGADYLRAGIDHATRRDPQS